MASTDEWIDELKSISVLELSERIKALEEEFGVSATAVAAAAPAGGGGGGGGGRGRGGAVRVRRRPHRRRRQEDPGHQGRPRGDRPRPQGGQGPRRRGPQARQGGRRQGRGRQAQGRARGGRRLRRGQVVPAGRTVCGGRPDGPPSVVAAVRRAAWTCETGPEQVEMGSSHLWSHGSVFRKFSGAAVVLYIGDKPWAGGSSVSAASPRPGSQQPDLLSSSCLDKAHPPSSPS